MILALQSSVNELVNFEEKYYIYFPASSTNYVVFADHIDGPLSGPVKLDITMFDPGHVLDKEGNK